MTRRAAVVAFFEAVAKNMAELPVFNHQLAVDASEFVSMDNHWLGVVVTPWCMNIVWLPDEMTHRNEQQTGSKFRQVLPSGEYEFIHAYHESIGDYATCSVFSPMFEFSEQETAMQTSRQVLKALFEADNHAPSERQLAEQTYVAQREAYAAQQAQEQRHNQQLAAAENEEQPVITRRAFLTGGLGRNEERGA